MKEEILQEYDASKQLLTEFLKKIDQLIIDLTINKKNHIHQIIPRLKTRDSLEKKIISKNDPYTSLADITDVVGIRVITYLESDIDIIAQLIKDQFIIDGVNSVDKRNLNADQFGYKSLHLIACLNESRDSLLEYSRFKNIKFEIQIRSILQHAWAEIEHDLGYKGKHTIPDTAKRSFNRLAALLEIADIEFDRLSKELADYEAKVSELILNEPQNVLINQASLMSFMNTNPVLQKAKSIIQQNTNCIYSTEDITYEYYINVLTNFFHLHTIQELATTLDTNQDLYLKFVDEFSKNNKFGEVTEGLSVFYLCHFLSAINEAQEEVTKYLKFGGMLVYGDEIFEEDADSNNNDFIKIIQKIKSA